MAATNQGQGNGKQSSKWARFGKIAVGYKNVQVPGQSVNGHWAPAHTERRVIYAAGGWLKVGSKRYNRAVSFIGPHGHQASIPKEFLVSPKRPGTPVSHSLPGSSRVKGPGNEVIGRNAKGAPTQTKGPSGLRSVGIKPKGSGGGGASKGTAQHNQQVVGSLIGKAKVNRLIPFGDAKAMADLQYGAQIGDTKLQQAEQQRQGSQDLADISHWYAQLAAQNQASAQQTQDVTSQASQAAQAATAKILQGIGGSANPGASQVAAQGADQVANIQALNTLQQMFSSNRGSADTAAQAGQMSAQQALNSQQAMTLAQQLHDLQGQRGNAIVSNQMQIRQANNASRQQNFGNTISRLDAILGAQQAAGNMRLQGMQIAAARAQTKAASSGGAGGFKPWGTLTANDKYGLVQQLMAPGAGGKVPTYQQALARGHALGYAPSNLAPYLGSFYGM